MPLSDSSLPSGSTDPVGPGGMAGGTSSSATSATSTAAGSIAAGGSGSSGATSSTAAGSPESGTQLEGSNGQPRVVGGIQEVDLLAGSNARARSTAGRVASDGGLAIVLIVLALIAAFGIALPISRLIGTGSTAPATIVSAIGWILLAIVLAAVAAILLRKGFALLPETKRDASGGNLAFRSTLLGSALIALGVGAAFMIIVSRLQDDILLSPPPTAGEAATQEPETGPVASPWANEVAVLIGIVATIVTAILYGIFSRDRARPDRANPWQYSELSARRDYLEACVAAYCPGKAETPGSKAACAEASAHLAQMEAALGQPVTLALDAAGGRKVEEESRKLLVSADKWALGTGFVELWQRLHATEAALLGQRPLAQRLSYGRQDLLRLSGCELETGGDLKLRLDEAITKLEAIPTEDPNGIKTPEEERATEILISVHKTIDDYRDQSRAGLARTRIHLIWAGTMTAVVTYILLALAILDDVEPYQIIAGGAYFLVGAVAGLIWQLRQSGSEVRSGEDDFGLDRARLVYVPVLSGLAGVGGVLLMALLYPTLNVVLDPTLSQEGQSVPEISQIFNLATNRFGLLVAAVFGLTPDLLINRLQSQADQYRAQLAATSPQTRSNEPVDTGLVEQLRAMIIEVKGAGTTDSTGVTGTTGPTGVTGQTDGTGGREGSGSQGGSGAEGRTDGSTGPSV
jgi:hypothetical protein